MTFTVMIFMLVGALISLVAAVRALWAYLGYRRARAAFRSEVTDEVTRLAERTTELEGTISALDTRAAELPIQISELQQSLTTMRVLTRALAASLRQVQKVISFSALKIMSADRIDRILQSAPAPKNTQRSR